jgi:hypothetical protein
VHFSTFFGADPQQLFSPFWLLHIGCFVVMIPAMVLQRHALPGEKPQKTYDQIVRYAPKWLRRITAVCGIYAIFNFVIFIFLMSGGSPVEQPTGTYSLRTHGKLIRPITEAEYHRYRGYIARGFSGHWMLFYSLSLTTLVSAAQARRHASHRAARSARGPTAGPPAGSPIQLEYTSRGGVVLPVWVHYTLVLASRIFCWLGFPLAVGLTFMPWLRTHLSNIDAIVIVVASAFVGVTVPAFLLNRYLPARCPSCGGQAYYKSSAPPRYHCRDCGQDVIASI